MKVIVVISKVKGKSWWKNDREKNVHEKIS